jgi:beta-lactamase superfamily II metal-dependent hydrolase
VNTQRIAWHALPLAIAMVALTLQHAELAPSQTLDIYAIDVEGGKATLIVSPQGDSLLADAGNPGARDAARIATIAKQAGVTAIDYLVISHYHADHVGGAAELMKRLPVRTFIDHGEAREPNAARTPEFQAYAAARSAGRYVRPVPGDAIPMRGLGLHVITSHGVLGTRPLKDARGAGEPNPSCAEFVPKAADDGENAMSVGFVIDYGRFRMLDLGDLPWNQSRDLVCPTNLFGTFDVYLTSMHGLDLSNPPVMLHAVRPRVVVMNNAARKGASRDTWTTIAHFPGADLWQLHFSVRRGPMAYYGETSDTGGNELNVSDQYIANIDEPADHDPAYFIKISVYQDGRFTVLNSRTGYRKNYTALR